MYDMLNVHISRPNILRAQHTQGNVSGGFLNTENEAYVTNASLITAN